MIKFYKKRNLIKSFSSLRHGHVITTPPLRHSYGIITSLLRHHHVIHTHGDVIATSKWPTSFIQYYCVTSTLFLRHYYVTATSYLQRVTSYPCLCSRLDHVLSTSRPRYFDGMVTSCMSHPRHDHVLATSCPFYRYKDTSWFHSPFCSGLQKRILKNKNGLR